jgi:DNA primase
VPRITRQSIEDVRQRADIVALIGDYTALKKSGASWRGLSPFAPEKTPSFYVHPDKGFFYCFSTTQGGDIFRFLTLKEGLSFQEAVERTAARFNIPLQYEEGGPTREERSLRAQLLAIHEAAASLYAKAFKAKDAGAAEVRDYWTQQRRFSLEIAAQFQIGFAPVDGGGLARALLQAGFGKEALAKSGLFTGMDYAPDPLRWRPKFRGRLIIPIRDVQGRTVAFTARLLPFVTQDERDPTRDSKYVNSPETEIFHKSQILFNLDKAREAASEMAKSHAGKSGVDVPFVLVEGQLDAIRAYSCGITTAVASQGTSIGAEHLALLRRYTRRVDALLDADRPGQAAALKLLPLAMRAGIEVRVLGVPGGKDPDEYFAGAGAEGLQAVLDSATSAIAFAVRGLLPPGVTHSTTQKLDALQAIFEIIAEAESAVARDDALREVCRLARVDPIAAQRDFQRFEQGRRRRAVSAATTSATATTGAEGTAGNGADSGTGTGAGAGASGASQSASAAPPPPLNTAEEKLLAFMLHYPGAASRLAERLDPAWIDTGTPVGRLLDRVAAAAVEGDWLGVETVHSLTESGEEANLVAGLLVAGRQVPGDAANAGLAALFNRFINRRRSEIAASIAALGAGDGAEDGAQLMELQRELTVLRKKLKEPPPSLPDEVLAELVEVPVAAPSAE